MASKGIWASLLNMPKEIKDKLKQNSIYGQVSDNAAGSVGKSDESRKAKLDVAPAMRRTSVTRFKSLPCPPIMPQSVRSRK